MKPRNLRALTLATLTIVPVVLLFLVPRFAQPLWYHDFADRRYLLWMPNMLNVVSNLPFVAIGVWGLIFLARCQPLDRFEEHRDRWYYAFFFVAVALTGIGSGYYHWEPSNDRLFWDRLPLALAFMALFAMIVAERVNHSAGVAIFVPLVLLGGASVVYWHMTEVWGYGDLRP